MVCRLWGIDLEIKTANRENFTAKQRKLSDIAYLVVHYTGNRGDTAKNNADYFAREVTGTSAHYFVDENEVWQTATLHGTAARRGHITTPRAGTATASAWRSACWTSTESFARAV